MQAPMFACSPCIAALYKDTFGDTPFATLSKWLIDNATPNVPIGAPWGTPRRLAYTNELSKRGRQRASTVIGRCWG